MKNYLSILKQVFSKAEYLFLFGATFFIVLYGAIAVKNLELLQQVLFSEALSLWQKKLFFASLLGSLNATFGIFGSIILLSVSFLFSINLALLIFYIRKIKSLFKGSKRVQAIGIGGLVSGLLGIGCAACGSIVLSAVLSSIGASSLLLLLPLHGSEFGLLGVSLLMFSIFSVLKKLQGPLVC